MIAESHHAKRLLEIVERAIYDKVTDIHNQIAEVLYRARNEHLHNSEYVFREIEKLRENLHNEIIEYNTKKD